MPRHLAVIPARGGSKRVPNKNIRDFCGKPMIAHILEAARDSGLFNEIHVSTDSAQIREVVEGLGFRVDFMRPAELADDQTPIMPVLKHVVEKFASLGREFQEVALLMACAPLISADDLRKAQELFAKHGSAMPVLGVAQYPCPIEWAFRRDAGGRLSPVQPGMFATRSQDLAPSYFDAGLFSIFPANFVLDSVGAGSDADFIGHILPRYKAIDIDTLDDWSLAEAIYRGARQSAVG